MIVDRRLESIDPIYGCSIGTAAGDDFPLISRAIRAYTKSTAAPADLRNSMWVVLNQMKSDVEHVFSTGDLDQAATILRNPGATNLYHGFDSSFAEALPDKSAPSYYATRSIDALARFAEAIGAIPLDYPDSYDDRDVVVLKAEDLLEKIERVSGWRFSVPNPFPHEHGIQTSRGVLSERAGYALYQAWRIQQLTRGIANPRVAEIGAGLGRTAYYARELGIADYTIVDLPLTSVSQAYWLGRVLGQDTISLCDEFFADADRRIKIIPPQAFLELDRQFDLIINIDSITEMDISIASTYIDKIFECAGTFFSINHEINDFRVTDLLTGRSNLRTYTRNPCWMRRGYVEEVAQIAPSRLES